MSATLCRTPCLLLFFFFLLASSSCGRLLIVDHSPSGSCYGPCFWNDRVEPPECPYSCDFKTVSPGSPEERSAAMVFRFMDSEPIPDLPSFSPRSSPDQLVALYVQESPLHFQPLLEERYMGTFNYSYTFHPGSTWYSGTYKFWEGVARCLAATGPGVPVSYEGKRQGGRRAMMSVWVSNCDFMTNDRRGYLRRLTQEEGITVASYGRCDHNAEPWVDGAKCRESGSGECPKWASECFSWEDRATVKIWTSAQHLFMWAAENSDFPYYHSEKLFEALGVGTIPVYMGSKTIRQFVPAGSIIQAEDFESPRELARYLKEVASNETLYNTFFEWRRKPLEPHILAELEWDKYYPAQFMCDVCKTAHLRPRATLKPMGW